ncbi:MAG: PKD domain-containing protein [Bacteroidia bacterium]
MKSFYLKPTSIFVFLLAFLLSQNVTAQLSGNYTIDPTKVPSSTNYANFSAAIADLVSGSRTDSGPDQGPGVSGAVTITAYDTVYRSQQLSIGAITGASATNTVTFTSASADSSICTLQNPSKTSSGGDFVIQLNGCDFVTFNSIGIERTGDNTYSTVIDITNTSNNCSFTNCLIKGRKVPSNSSNGFVYGIGSLVLYSGVGNNTVLSNNKMIYGYNGIYSTTANSGIRILNNVLDTIGSSGIYMSGQRDLTVNGNTFNMGDFGPSKGHYVSYGIRVETATQFVFTNNKIDMMAVNGQVVRAVMLANLTGNTSSSRSLVANNFITMSGGTGNCTGIALYNSFWVDMFHNNINITSSLKSGACFYVYPQYSNSNLRLINNTLVNSGGGFVYSVDGTNTGNISSLRNNACYHTGTYLAEWNGSDYTSFANWRSGSRRDTNSVYADPGFVSNQDLHVSNIALNGKGMTSTGITTDIDGDSRSSTTPDIGADEFFPANTDIGISKLDSPAAFCAGSYNVKVSFQNYGIDTITSASLNWSVNGTAQKSFSWSGKLAPGASADGITIGTYTFSANKPYSFKLWTSAPNSKTDGKNINDTLSITKLTGISGTYTIGSSKSADYKSFNEAITQITARGLCGATTFNIEDGVYKEQITLTQLDGMGPSAPLTFQGKSQDSSKVVITLPSTTATGNNNAACQLRGGDNITFKHITFKRTGFNPFAHVIHVLNGSHNNTFTNCQMIGTVVTSANANLDAANIISDQGRDTNNVFLNNYVKHGTFNIYWGGVGVTGETGLNISGNIFDSAYTSAIDIQNNDKFSITNNIFRTIRNTLTDNASINLTSCDSALSITGNKINDPNAHKGIRLTDCTASNQSPSIIANNMITREDGQGIEFNGAYNYNVVFNSIYFWGDGAGNSAISTTNSQNGGIGLYNNCIVMDSGLVYNIWLKGHISGSDYNNFMSESDPQFFFNGKWFKTLNAYNKQTKLDSNSWNINPYYISRYDLHARNTSLNGAGTPIAGVFLDFDGESRNSTSPDIGCDEFDAQPNDAGAITFSSPATAACEGNNDINVVIKNFGTDDLKSVTINWVKDGNSQTAYNWTGNLKSLETDTIKLDSDYFASTSTLKLSAYTSNPNGKTDGFTYNDQVDENRGFLALPLARAGIDKIMCPGDSVRIGTKGSSFYTYEWFDINNNKIGEGDRLYVKPSSSLQFYQKVTHNTQGCINYDTLLVEVGAAPKVDIISDQSICQGGSISLGGLNQSGNSYEWSSTPSGFSSTVSNPTASPKSSTVYTLLQTIDSTKCAASATVEITVNPKPSTLLSGETTTCQGQTIEYNTNNVSSNTYTWTISNATLQSGTGNSTGTVKFDNIGSATVQIIEENSFGCTDTSIVNVEVGINPSAEFSFSNVCANEAIEFEDLSTDNSARTWDFGNGTTSAKKKPENTYTNTGTYTVQLIATTVLNCVDTIEKSIEISDKPYVYFTVNETACTGNSIDISNASSGNGTYEWDFGDGSTSNDNTPSYAYNAAGSYKVRLIRNNNGCKDSLKQSLTVNESPIATFTATVDGATISLTANDQSHSQYEWNFGDGNTANGTTTNYKYNIKTGWAKVSLTVTGANGCSSTTTDSAYIDVSSIGQLPSYANSISVYPNPTHNNAVVDLILDKNSDLQIQLFDLQGRQVKSLFTGHLTRGNNKIELNNLAHQLNSGTYMLIINFNNEATVAQMIQIR